MAGSKDVVDITPNELAFAAEHGPAYHVYRVVGVGGPSPAITVLRDPVGMIRRRAVSLCLIL